MPPKGTCMALVPAALLAGLAWSPPGSEALASRAQCFALPHAPGSLGGGLRGLTPSLQRAGGPALAPLGAGPTGRAARGGLGPRCQGRKDEDGGEGAGGRPFISGATLRALAVGAAAAIFFTSQPTMLEATSISTLQMRECMDVAGYSECLNLKAQVDTTKKKPTFTPWNTANNPTRKPQTYIEPPFDDPEGPELNVFESAVSGAAAGGARAVSIILTFPLDTIKTRKQLAPTKPAEETEGGGGGGGGGGGSGGGGDGGRGVVREREVGRTVVAEKVVTKERVRTLGTETAIKKGGLYAGWLPRILIAIPAQAMFFVTHDSINFFLGGGSVLGVPLALSPRIVELVSSLAATFPSNAIRIPVEAIKQRMQAGEEASALGAAKNMMAKDGVAGLYKGSSSMLAREIPWNLWQFFVFAELCRRVQEAHGGAPLTITENALIGLVAAGSAAWVTQPFDVVKTRQMVGRRGGSIFGEMKAIVEKEGIKNLWLGATQRLMIVGFGGGVYFWAHEVVERLVD